MYADSRVQQNFAGTIPATPSAKSFESDASETAFLAFVSDVGRDHATNNNNNNNNTTAAPSLPSFSSSNLPMFSLHSQPTQANVSSPNFFPSLPMPGGLQLPVLHSGITSMLPPIQPRPIMPQPALSLTPSSPDEEQLSSKETSARLKQLKRYRDSHNEVERRRRENINQVIGELATMVPDCYPGQSKGSILRKTADFIRSLQRQGIISTPSRHTKSDERQTNYTGSNSSGSPSPTSNGTTDRKGGRPRKSASGLDDAKRTTKRPRLTASLELNAIPQEQNQSISS